MSWMRLFWGGCFLAAVAVMAFALLLQFLRDRPADLRAHTELLADRIEDVLERTSIPAQEIRRAPPAPREDARGRWYYHRFEVEAPPQVKFDSYTAQLRKSILEYPVSLHEQPGQDGVLRMTLALRDFEFAEILLRSAPPGPAERIDMREESLGIAREFEALLLDAGVDESGLSRLSTEEKQDADAWWTATWYRAALPEGVSPDTIREETQHRMIARGIVPRLQRSESAQHRLSLFFNGKECVRADLEIPIAEVEETVETVAEEEDESPDQAQETEGTPEAEGLPLDSSDHAAAPVPLPPGPRDKTIVPRVAIILDDGGYGGPVSANALALDPALTLAILPNTPFAGETAKQALEKGFEVILHMPMETGGAVRQFPGEITTAMDKEEIQRLVRDALDQVPEAVGMNNHTGSKFTGNLECMNAVLEVLKERDLFFVDSRTNAVSRAMEAARETGVPTAERDVFLDNSGDPDLIRQQLELLINRAKVHGEAIGIGHFRKNTVAVLAEELPRLRKEGIVFTHVSEFVQ